MRPIRFIKIVPSARLTLIFKNNLEATISPIGPPSRRATVSATNGEIRWIDHRNILLNYH